MIHAVFPETKQQELDILSSMPEFKDHDYSVVCGLWKDNRFIGGVLVLKHPGNFIAWQWENTGDPTLGTALTDIFYTLFNKWPKLKGSIKLSNVKSLKAAKQLGFYNIYKENNHQIVEVSKDSWRLKRKVK